jgi:hypothetical protein
MFTPRIQQPASSCRPRYDDLIAAARPRRRTGICSSGLCISSPSAPTPPPIQSAILARRARPTQMIASSSRGCTTPSWVFSVRSLSFTQKDQSTPIVFALSANTWLR